MRDAERLAKLEVLVQDLNKLLRKIKFLNRKKMKLRQLLV